MNHAFSQAELDLLRTRPQGAKWFLAHHVPRTLATLSLAATPQVYPASAVEYTGASVSAMAAGQTIWVGNNNSSNIGKVRLRGAPTTNGSGASILPIAESGCALINWKQATTLVIKEEYRPWAKHPRYDSSASQWRMDYDEAYTTSVIAPYPNMGAPIVGFLENGSFTASFTNRNHLFWDSPSLQHVWEFPHGSITSGENDFLMTFTGASPNGSYIKLSATNESGVVTVGYRLIFLFNSEDEVPNVVTGEIQGGIDPGGYRAQVRILEDGQHIQDESEVILFDKAYYNQGTSSFGGNSASRGNILLRGWIPREGITRKPFYSYADIEIGTLNDALDATNSYDIFYAQSSPVSGASHWIHQQILNLDRVAMNIAAYRSTIINIADFTPMSGVGIQNGLILFQSLPKSSIWTQLKQNYNQKGVLGTIACDMQGNIHAFQDTQISGGSNNIPMVINLRDEDLMDEVVVRREHRDRNAYVRLEAVSSATPLGAESPGVVQGYYGGEQQITRGLTTPDQDTLITWAGNLRAKLNNKNSLLAKLAGNYKIDAVPQHRIKYSMAASDNPRGFEQDQVDYVQKTLRLNYEASDQFAFATIEADEIVNGIGGSAITFPKPSEIIPIPTPYPDPPSDPPGNQQGGGFGTVYVMTQDTLGRTRSFSSGSPSWSNITPGVGLELNDFILDPWSPSTTGYITTNDGVWKSTTLDFDSPSWIQMISKSEIESQWGVTDVRYPNKIVASINVQDWVGFWFVSDSISKPNFTFARSSDGGTTWSFALVMPGTAFPGIENANTFGGTGDIVPHLVGGNIVLYAAMNRGPSATTRSLYYYKSTDGGATWIEQSILGSNVDEISFTTHCPYTDNEAGNIVYSWGAVSGGAEGLAYSTDSAVTWNIATPTNTINTTPIHRWGCETYTQSNQSYLWYWDGSNHILYVSDTPGGSFEARSMNGLTGAIYTSGGFPYVDSQFYAVGANGIFVSTDGGNNWSDKTGDWAFGFTSTYSLNKPKGGSVSVNAYVIVPNWTE